MSCLNFIKAFVNKFYTGKWEPEEEEKLCEIVYKLSCASPGLWFELIICLS